VIHLKNIIASLKKGEYALIFLILFTTGLASMVYEIVFLSVMSIYLGVTEYTSSLVIAAFMAGLALGSLTGGFITRIFSGMKYWLAGIELIIAMYGFSFFFILKILDLSNFRGFPLLLACTILVIIPSFFMGAEIPVAVFILNKQKGRSGFDTGFAYSSDTIGGIIGALITGWFLIPAIGMRGSFFFGAILNSITFLFSFLIGWKGFIKRAVIIASSSIGLAALVFLLMNSSALSDIAVIKPNYLYPIIKEVQTPHQRIMVIDNPYFKHSLILDGYLQVTEHDSTMYHEMLVLPAMNIHPNPKKVLIIGGGDGGALHQVTKFDVEDIDLVDIDGMVINISRELLPSVSKGAFEDQRLNLVIDDGRKFIEQHKNSYDIIIIDLPDPAKLHLALLYSKEFYSLVRDSLRKNGIMVTQSSSPIGYLEANTILENTVRDVFKFVGQYSALVSSFRTNSFIIASDYINVTKQPPPLKVESKWYDPRDYNNYFFLPKFITQFKNNNTLPVSTDDNLLVYKYSQPHYFVRGISDVKR
jgi:spermidine synthase